MTRLTNLFRRPTRGGAIALMVVLAVGVSACGGDDGEVPRGAVATVDDKPISKSEFDHWVTVVAASQQQQQPGRKSKPPKPPKRGTPQYEQLRDQVMQFLVSAQWIAGEASDRGLAASEQEVKRSFERTRDQSFPSKKAYERFLKSTGQTQEDIDFRVRSDVLANKVRTEVTKDTGEVTDDDIKNYYEQNEAQFSQPERRDIQQVVNKDEDKAREALQRIQDGESFKRVAKDLSTDRATKQQGGRLLGVAQGQQERTLDEAIFKAEKGKLVGPIKTSRGFYVFEVTRVTPASKQSLEQSKEGIRQLLLAQSQQQSLDAFTQDFRSKWRDRTNCEEGYVIPDCSNGELPPTPGQVVGPPARSGAGNPPGLGGTQPAAPQAGVPGAPPTAPGAATGTGPPATSGTGTPPALGAAPAGPQAGVPQQGVPQQGVPQQGAPQGGQPPQGAQPPGG
jgi:foldase protein PrsA